MRPLTMPETLQGVIAIVLGLYLALGHKRVARSACEWDNRVFRVQMPVNLYELPFLFTGVILAVFGFSRVL